MKLNEFIPKWVEALRSGKFKPTKGLMITYCNREPNYCFMGVASKVLGFEDYEIVGKKSITQRMAKGREVPAELVGGYKANGIVHEITTLNDVKGYTQDQFANWLEDHLPSPPKSI